MLCSCFFNAFVFISAEIYSKPIAVTQFTTAEPQTAHLYLAGEKQKLYVLKSRFHICDTSQLSLNPCIHIKTIL